MRGVARRPRRASLASTVGSAAPPDDLAEHQLDDPLLRARRDVDDADGLALAQHGRAVADGGDLDHPVRDEDDRAVATPLAADDLEHALGEVRPAARRSSRRASARRARWPARGRGR